VPPYTWAPMHRLPRRSTILGVALLVAFVAGCATTPVAPDATLASISPIPDTAEARDAFAVAICPIFVEIAALDPRLASMRTAGGTGGDMTVHDAELTALSDDLLAMLIDLEALPDWRYGQRLQFELITALHAVRAQILVVSDDLGASDAAEGMAAIPFVASDAMDLAISTATTEGLTCGDGS
jgi:hypothetical protein